MGTSEGGRRWSVGELAQASGVTVRALHYYDEIGLVSPGERTPAGHRRYTEPEVRRLYRVRALHQLGFSLDEIGSVLEAGAEDFGTLRDLLVAQLAELAAQATRIDERRRRVRGLLDRLESGLPEAEELLTALELTVPLVDTRGHLNQDQRDALQHRGADLGDETVGALKGEWLGLVERLRELLHDGVPADDRRVRDLADRWWTIGATLRGATGGDEGMNAALAGLWRDKRAVIDRGMAERVDWLAAGDLVAVVEYVGRARHVGRELREDTDGPG